MFSRRQWFAALIGLIGYFCGYKKSTVSWFSGTAGRGMGAVSRARLINDDWARPHVYYNGVMITPYSTTIDFDKGGQTITVKAYVAKESA
jgi:hypothetical protein